MADCCPFGVLTDAPSVAARDAVLVSRLAHDRGATLTGGADTAVTEDVDAAWMSLVLFAGVVASFSPMVVVVAAEGVVAVSPSATSGAIWSPSNDEANTL